MNHFQNEVPYQPGDIVYVFYRNPHTQDVANIQEAAVVRHPEDPNQLAIFLYETYYPLTDEIAVFSKRARSETSLSLFF
jgi:transcriptional regulator of the spore photoproduct lyase operon